MKLFISPPYSNYHSYIRHINKCVKNYSNVEQIIPIIGSYSTFPDSISILRQTIKSLQHHSYFKNWEISSRPNVKFEQNTNISNAIVSVGIFDKDTISCVEQELDPNVSIELNIMTPDFDIVQSRRKIETLLTYGLDNFRKCEREWCPIRLPILYNIENIDILYDAGFRQFHCTGSYMPDDPVQCREIQNIRQKYEDIDVIMDIVVRDDDFSKFVPVNDDILLSVSLEK
jgi:hypothetical protein